MLKITILKPDLDVTPTSDNMPEIKFTGIDNLNELWELQPWFEKVHVEYKKTTGR